METFLPKGSIYCHFLSVQKWMLWWTGLPVAGRICNKVYYSFDVSSCTKQIIRCKYKWILTELHFRAKPYLTAMVNFPCNRMTASQGVGTFRRVISGPNFGSQSRVRSKNTWSGKIILKFTTWPLVMTWLWVCIADWWVMYTLTEMNIWPKFRERTKIQGQMPWTWACVAKSWVLRSIELRYTFDHSLIKILPEVKETWSRHGIQG